MNKFCLYSDSPLEAPCITIIMEKYSYLKDFLDNNPQKSKKRYSVPLRIECINIGEKEITTPRCISCMFCVYGCVGNKILLKKDFHPEKMCVDITHEQIQELKGTFFPLIFKGSFLKLPQVPLTHLQVNYRSFCDFTSVDETKNIAVWGANALKYLSSSLDPRVALEVGVNITDRNRAGRLDITLMNLSTKHLFVAETKTSFNDMMQELRFESQMLSYETVLSAECDQTITRCKFLLIGGNESDLLPPTHLDCTSNENQAKQFYNILKKQKLFFISANALLALGLMKMFVSQNKYNLENLYPYITNEQYLGLLSAGLITKEGNVTPYV